ncbi:MAG: hypothetical protein WB797_13725 [Nocardioides sp.]
MVQARVAIAAATTLLVGLGTAGCGAHHAPDRAATGTPPASHAGHDSGHAHKSHSKSHKGGRQGGPGKGTYDDTSGTRAKAPKNQNAVLTHLPGSKKPGCVAVGTRADVRSGHMAMGNFADARAQFSKAKSAYDAGESFFYVIPMSRSVKSVTVTATRIGGRGAPVRVRSSHVEQAAQWDYFPIHITLPASGTWRFRVTSASARSCFDARFAT